jgi:hypothetical protein
MRKIDLAEAIQLLLNKTPESYIGIWHSKGLRNSWRMRVLTKEEGTNFLENHVSPAWLPKNKAFILYEWLIPGDVSRAKVIKEIDSKMRSWTTK